MLYSVHFFDGEGRQTAWEEIECASEAEAINAMLDASAGRGAELWLTDRKLMSWPADGRPRPTAPRSRTLRRATLESAMSLTGGL
jgi:hypothetical protein